MLNNVSKSNKLILAITSATAAKGYWLKFVERVLYFFFIQYKNFTKRGTYDYWTTNY